MTLCWGRVLLPLSNLQSTLLLHIKSSANNTLLYLFPIRLDIWCNLIFRGLFNHRESIMQYEARKKLKTATDGSLAVEHLRDRVLVGNATAREFTTAWSQARADFGKIEPSLKRTTSDWQTTTIKSTTTISSLWSTWRPYGINFPFFSKVVWREYVVWGGNQTTIFIIL